MKRMKVKDKDFVEFSQIIEHLIHEHGTRAFCFQSLSN